jgi:putative peptide zinc metalloprotease protein
MDTALDMALPPLREDLTLDEAGATGNGEPAWVIQDAVVNRFYRIGWLEFECLLRWGGTARDIARDISQSTSLHAEPEQVLDFRGFLERNHLLRPGAASLDTLRTSSEGSRWLTWRWWLHHYLFFRIPLVRPQRFLGVLARHLGWVFHRATLYAVLAVTLVGVLLVARQWDEFTHAVVGAFSVEGLLGFAVALIIGKTLHEFGHAVVATHHGLRVAHMGVAFVVMWPMLYTDTGEAWKLRNARQRLAIASAGVVTELALAGISTFLWAITDPGTLRNAFLYLATTNWVLTLGLNASPFTRFDGYFILSDLLDFPNLHERSSALARVAIRRRLLGLREPWPEPIDPHRRRLLIGFAIVTWVYRFALFLGIAVAVYYLFFKALGIFLFMVEVSWFLAMPIVNELRHWYRHRAAVPGRYRAIWTAALFAALVLLAVPWRTQVHAYGVARATRQQHVFAPFPARLHYVRPRGDVAAGDVLAVLEQPDISARVLGNESSLRGLQAQLTGLLAQPGGNDEQAATRERLQVQFQEVRSAREEVARLTLRAPYAGRWTDVDPDWHAGQWVRSNEVLGTVMAPDAWQIDAYVPQEDVYRIREGDTASFVADGMPAALQGTVASIGSTRAAQVDHAMLTSRYGGPLSSAKKGDELASGSPVFRVVILLHQPPGSLRQLRGQAQITGERRSLLGRAFTRVLSVGLEQSGF